MKSLNLDYGTGNYEILIEKGLIEKISPLIKKIYKGKKLFIISDKNVFNLHGEKLINILKAADFEVEKLVLPAGEKTKIFETLPKIYNAFIAFGLSRSDMVINFGGGVVGDLGGSAASTYLRGIDFIQIPTSLLAQVDSSVGGKLGVDLPQGKNLVGCFAHPKAVFIDTLLLKTLPQHYLNDGMGEVIKYGIIKDKNLFEKLLGFLSKDELINNIEDIIFECCDIKRKIVQNDEKDTGERMLLNFGHTIGHAIEKYYDFGVYSHGEAVCIGMYIISLFGEKKGLTQNGTAEKIKNILIKYNLPYQLENIDKTKLISAFAIDKKNMNGTLNLIFAKKIGSAFIYKTDISFLAEAII